MMETSDLESELKNQHGPVIGGKELMQALGFLKMPSFRKAIREGRLEVKVFEMPGHRGKFALTKDVAAYIEKCVRR